MEQYKVSVVIPVYNCEKYIERCVKSIQEQNYENLKEIQVILINDGSTDSSLEKCMNLKKDITDFEVEVITGENEGVSVARNKGIKASKGKYIMFLDSDDFISKNAIKELVTFFDEHYDEIDLVTYPMYTLRKGTNKKQILQRYKKYFDETKVYDLENNYEAIQPTMNIIIKNQFEKNILFNTNVFYHEDTLYNTSILFKKEKIGYVKNAKYYYRVYDNNTTSNKGNPLYSFEQYMTLFEVFVNDYKDENGKVPKFIQRNILNVLRWRLMTDKIFPYQLEGKEWDEAYNRIVNIIKQIDNENIMQYQELNIYQKMYFLRLKEEQILLNYGFNSEIALTDKKGTLLYVENKIEIVIDRFKVKNDKIYILGILKSPILMYVKPEMYVEYENDDKNKENIELSDTVQSRYKTNVKIVRFYKFECELSIKDLKKFGFGLYIDGRKYNYEVFFNTWTPFSNENRNQKIYYGKYKIFFKNNEFFVTTPNKEVRKKDFKVDIEKYKYINKNINLYRVLAKILGKKQERIWIYNDRKNVYDNAYVQFKHDVKIKDDIKKYYVVSGKKENYIDKFKGREKKYLVKFGSLKHKLLFLNSDKIITSFSSLQDYSPLYTYFQNYKDIIKYDLIYVQHGLLHARLLKMYAKTVTPIDKIVVSSEFEKNNLINNYDYSEKDIITVGMPRLDIKEEVNAENKIIFAPSWRKYLIGDPIKRKRKTNKPKFIQSKYYKEIVAFLKNEKLINKLKEKNIILDFKLHPIFEPYKGCFDDLANDNITVTIGNTDLGKYKAFITDFSSFQFDFVNLGRPILYFVPDMPEFKAGLHTYRELDLKYEDAFGNLCENGKQLVDELIKLIDNDFQAQEKYKKRMDDFFYKVENRMDKLYEILKQS